MHDDDPISNLQPYFESLEKAGLAEVKHHELKGDTFIDLTIEGIRFRGFVCSEGPCIELKSGGVPSSVQLGVSSINRCTPTFCCDNTDARWFVAKYHTQGHIEVHALSDTGRRRLAYEFGLLIHANKRLPFSVSSECDAFYGSKAFRALQAWAKAHPRKIRRFQANVYLGDWPTLAEFGLTIRRSSNSAGDGA